jgi:hypothetical protein
VQNKWLKSRRVFARTLSLDKARLSLVEPRAIAQCDRYFQQVLAAVADYSVDLTLKTL